MQVFWASGYEGTSIPMLTDAMGISAQSLYAAFGSKEALYREALDFYGSTIGGYVVKALTEEENAIDSVIRVLRESAAAFGRTTGIPGCMITTTPADANPSPLVILGRELRAGSVSMVRARLEDGIAKGQVRPDIDPSGWARYVGSVVQGMSIQARDGAPANELLNIAEIAAETLNSIRTAPEPIA